MDFEKDLEDFKKNLPNFCEISFYGGRHIETTLNDRIQQVASLSFGHKNVASKEVYVLNTPVNYEYIVEISSVCYEPKCRYLKVNYSDNEPVVREVQLNI